MSATTHAGRHRGLGTAVGVAGELLLTAGVVLGLYVAWQVWWTSVEASGRTAEVRAAVTAEMAAPVPDEAAPADVFGSDVPPPLAPPGESGGLGILHVPVWGEDYAAPILDGTGDDVLATGSVGHYEGTALPGEIGNAALAGHRLTRGNPLLHVDDLAVGDAVVVETPLAWLVYRITGDEIVAPSDIDVLLPVPRRPGATPTQRLLTLTTCHPITSRTHRWITHLELSHWTLRDAGVPPELAGRARAATLDALSGGR